MVFFRSVDDDTWFEGSKIEKPPKTGIVTVKYGGFVIEDLGENS
jgi:hypothetical protein